MPCSHKLGRRARRRIKKILWDTFGDKCCWCNEPMLMPKHGQCMKHELEELATIEHHFAKLAGQPEDLMFLRLAHRKCNI